MLGGKIKWIQQVALVALLSLPVWADTRTDLDALKSEKVALDAELKKLDAKLVVADSAAKAEQKRSVELEARYKADLARRKTEIDSLGSKLSKLASELQVERNKQASTQISLDNGVARRKSLSAGLASATQQLEALVARSIPWDRTDRLERIRSLRRDLEAGVATPEEGFSRLRALYAEEQRFGDEIVVLNKPVARNNGEQINAKVLRLGNQWMVYVDDEGKRYGILRREVQGDSVVYKWKEDLSFEERQAVQFAVDVKQAKKPPQMVTLPLNLSIDAEPSAVNGNLPVVAPAVSAKAPQQETKK